MLIEMLHFGSLVIGVQPFTPKIYLFLLLATPMLFHVSINCGNWSLVGRISRSFVSLNNHQLKSPLSHRGRKLFLKHKMAMMMLLMGFKKEFYD